MMPQLYKIDFIPEFPNEREKFQAPEFSNEHKNIQMKWSGTIYQQIVFFEAVHQHVQKFYV